MMASRQRPLHVRTKWRPEPLPSQLPASPRWARDSQGLWCPVKVRPKSHGVRAILHR